VKTATKIVGALFFICLLGYVGERDFQDEKTAFALYCQNVFVDRIWPDYDAVGEENCREHLLLK